VRGAFAISLAIVLVSACRRPSRLAAVPSAATMRAAVPGMPSQIRYWAMGDPRGYLEEAIASDEREKRHLARMGHEGPLPPAHFLAISGGGGDGAYAAGLLSGWTQAGTRPQFKVVTGISTGALAAPYAFLGSAYDDKLRRVFTMAGRKDVLTPRHFWAAFFSDALADTTPLSALVARHIDGDILARVAAEYLNGRLLVVGTTDLDAGQPVLWNMGAIAASGRPGALELFRRVLMAATAVPAAFPPVMIDVDVEGRRYQEMHVDGGTTAQVFVYPAEVQLQRELRARGVQRERILYVIRNARLDPDWTATERKTLSIAQGAITSLIRTQGFGDLYRIFALARRDGVDYNLACIPRDFTVRHPDDFDPEYMRQLFEHGRRQAAAGYSWEKVPPGYGETRMK
jgi:predicted acylesterase/phospholipase RssA